MLVEVKYLVRSTNMIAQDRKEIYDVPTRGDAYKNLVERYGKENILMAEFKEIESDAQAFNVHEGSESQSAIFGDGWDA